MKKSIQTKQAPQAIGPYSQAIQANGFVFLSGQIPLTAEGDIVLGSVEKQTKQVMHNLAMVLKEADLSFDNVVKTTIYLDDMNDFSKVNEVYAAYFSNEPPARACVEVSRLPKDVKVEVDMIACLSFESNI